MFHSGHAKTDRTRSLTETTWNAEVLAGGESLLSGIRTTAMDLTKVTELGNGTVVLTYTPGR